MKPEWISALSPGNLAPDNFDRRRFEAMVYTMMAAFDPTGDWMDFNYEKHDRKQVEQLRDEWLSEATRIKPDFAPAYYIKADMIATIGDRKTEEEYASAKVCLAKAERYTRSGDLRALIQKLRREQPGKLE